MYKEKIIDGATGEITWRDYTPEEIAAVEKAIEEANKRKAQDDEAQAKKQSAINKLIDLGLTEEEVKAFLG